MWDALISDGLNCGEMYNTLQPGREDEKAAMLDSENAVHLTRVPGTLPDYPIKSKPSGSLPVKNRPYLVLVLSISQCTSLESSPQLKVSLQKRVRLEVSIFIAFLSWRLN